VSSEGISKDCHSRIFSFLIEIGERRVALLPVEMATMGDAMEAYFAEQVRERQSTSTGGAKPKLKPACGNLPQAECGKSRDKVARAADMSEPRQAS